MINRQSILPLGEAAVDRHHKSLRCDDLLFGERHRCNVIGTAAAIGIGIAGAAGSIGGGLLAKSGADKQADSTLKAAQLQVDENKRQFNQTQANQAPWMGTGAAAEGRLAYLLGLNPTMGNTQQSFTGNFGPQGNSYLNPANGKPSITNAGAPLPTFGKPLTTFQDALTGRGRKFAELSGGMDPIETLKSGQQLAPISGTASVAAPSLPPTADPNFGSLMRDFTIDDFQKDPAYDFTLSEGQKALDRSAAARGVLGSGTYLKDLTKYNQDYANTKYDESYNRFNNNRTTKYNFLAGPAGLGQQTAAQVGQLGAQYAGINGGILSSANNTAAQLRASGYGDLAGGIAGLVPTALGGYQALRGGSNGGSYYPKSGSYLG